MTENLNKFYEMSFVSKKFENNNEIIFYTGILRLKKKCRKRVNVTTSFYIFLLIKRFSKEDNNSIKINILLFSQFS